MKCLKCGHENPPNLPWCDRCITPFPSHKHRFLVCPKCRHENDADAIYCEICHEHLRPGQCE